MGKKDGQSFYTILKRLMNGDKTVYDDFNIEEACHISSGYIDTDKFVFSSSKFIKPDSVSFIYGIRWNTSYIYEYSEVLSEKHINFGDSVFISLIFYDYFCDNVRFTYDNGRKESVVDRVYDSCYARSAGKIDYVDDVNIDFAEPINGMSGIQLKNVMLTGRDFLDGVKEIDRVTQDWFVFSI